MSSLYHTLGVCKNLDYYLKVGIKGMLDNYFIYFDVIIMVEFHSIYLTGVTSTFEILKIPISNQPLIK